MPVGLGAPGLIYDPITDMGPKGGSGGSLPPGYGPGSPPNPSGPMATIGAGGGFGAQAPPYDRMPPTFGYSRRPMGGAPGIGSYYASPNAMGGQPSYGAYQQPGAFEGAASPMGQNYGLNGGQQTPWSGGANPFTDPGSWYNSRLQASGGKFTDPMSQLNSIIQSQVLSGGMFDPTGSTPLLQSMYRNLAQQMGGRQAGIANSLRSSGISDPNNFAMGQLMGNLGASNDMSQALSNAQLQSAMMNQQLLGGLYGNLQGTGSQAQLAQLQAALQPKQPSPWGQILGGIAGNLIPGIGSLFGGGGGGGLPGGSADYTRGLAAGGWDTPGPLR